MWWLVLCVSLATAHPSYEGVFSRDERIVAGHQVDITEFPWQAFLWTQYEGAATGACGASVIADQWVVTAAHCIYDAIGGLVFVGGNSWVAMMQMKEGEAVGIAEIFVHPSYEPHTNKFLHDIALLRLMRPLNFTDSVASIELQDEWLALDTSHPAGTATGWGTTAAGSDTLSTYLLGVSQRSIQLHQCVKVYGETVNSPSIMCTEGYHHTDGGICKGDSGGPLSFYNHSQDAWTLVGVSAFRAEQCSTIAPTGFTRVDYYRQWIMDVSGI